MRDATPRGLYADMLPIWRAALPMVVDATRCWSRAYLLFTLFARLMPRHVIRLHVIIMPLMPPCLL